MSDQDISQQLELTLDKIADMQEGVIQAHIAAASTILALLRQRLKSAQPAQPFPAKALRYSR